MLPHPGHDHRAGHDEHDVLVQIDIQCSNPHSSAARFRGRGGGGLARRGGGVREGGREGGLGGGGVKQGGGRTQANRSGYFSLSMAALYLSISSLVFLT